MTSIQENLARVREGLASYETAPASAADRMHDDILSAHASAFQEHERSQRDSGRSSRNDRARKHSSRDRDGKDSGRSMRFRFKNADDEHWRKRRKRHHKKTPHAEEEETAHNDDVERFTAHPLRRPPPDTEAWLDDDDRDPQTRSTRRAAPDADPDLAFQESLFDALADDEGAAVYWEHVYSQPVHIYSRPRVEKEDGKLEDMTDAEYAAYVKRKMWERLHPEEARELAARQEKEQQRRRGKPREERPRRRREEVEGDVQAALDRGTARRWTSSWRAYQARWAEVDAGKVQEFPWPTESGARTGRNIADEARAFLEGVVRYALPAMVEGDEDLVAAKRVMLKAERFRWHPDKMMQRFGKRLEEKGEMEDVTAVFQVVDEMLAGVGK